MIKILFLGGNIFTLITELLQSKMDYLKVVLHLSYISSTNHIFNKRQT